MKGWLIFIIVFFSLAAVAGIVTGIILSKKKEITTYSCNSATGKCEKNKNGNYKSLKDCEDNCKKISPDKLYKCINGNCVQDPSGTLSLEDCNKICKKKPGPPAPTSQCSKDSDCNSNNCEVCKSGKCQSSCSNTQVCNSGNCCTPKCDGKKCGDDDGCGGKCMYCPDGEFCNPETKTCGKFPYGIEVSLGNRDPDSKILLPSNIKCTPATCPQGMGDCVPLSNEVKQKYKTNPELLKQFKDTVCHYSKTPGFVPFYGYTKNDKPVLTCTNYCELGLNDPNSQYGCSGAIGPPKKFVESVKKWLIKNNQTSPSGKKITESTHFGVGAAPPLMIGNSPDGYVPASSDNIYQGGTNNFGVLYEMQDIKGNMAIVLLVDRCAGYVYGTDTGIDQKDCTSMGINICKDIIDKKILPSSQPTSKEGGECLIKWNEGQSSDPKKKTNITPVCPCIGTVTGGESQGIETCCGTSPACCGGTDASKLYYKDCDWCASQNHPHIDLDNDTFKLLSEDETGHFEPYYVHYWQVVPIDMFHFGDAGGVCEMGYEGKCAEGRGENFIGTDGSTNCCCSNLANWDSTTKQCNVKPKPAENCPSTNICKGCKNSSGNCKSDTTGVCWQMSQCTAGTTCCKN